MNKWPHTADELGEFLLVMIFCVLPSIAIIMVINDIICGV